MERLQKLLAAAGISSRRKAEDLILQGRVTVDGRKITQLGEKADPSLNRICVDGEPIRIEPQVYIILNKPEGYVTTLSDPDNRPTVSELVREPAEMLRPVGRLDIDTEGLLLLTNDGQLAHRLTHPRWQVTKVYHAQVAKSLNAATLRRLRQGIELEEGTTSPAQARMLPRKRGPALLEIGIHTGWHRQVRRMLAAVGHPVLRLRRVKIGPAALGNLPIGKWRRLNPVEIQALKKAVGLGVSKRG